MNTDDTSPAYEQTEPEKQAQQTREAARRARADRIRDRVHKAQALMRDELARPPALPTADQCECANDALTLEKRYELFRTAVETTVREMAPDVAIVTDKLAAYDAMVALSHAGETVSGTETGALRHPALSGTSLAAALCRDLQKKLGKRATGAE